MMGSPESEDGHHQNEFLRPAQLTRRIAVSDREITWEQFNPFDHSSRHDRWERQFTRKITSREPAFGVSWYDALCYCRWLTEQANLPESEQCYDPAESLSKDAELNPEQWHVHHDRSGFRLLTDAEWECVCRSGMNTAYSFGSDRQLLSHYGWNATNSEKWSRPVCELRPNLRGLFDTHGNLYEWCYDKGSYDGPSQSTRMNRGGSYNNLAAGCRSAHRNKDWPSTRLTSVGFRVAQVPFARFNKPVIGARTAPRRQVKPTTPTDPDSDRSVDHAVLNPEESKRGFLVSTSGGLRFITPIGEVKKLPAEATTERLSGKISAFDASLFVYQGQKINEVDSLGNILRTISVERGVRGRGFAALPDSRFAVFDNEDDKIYLLHQDGAITKILSMLNEPDRHSQSTHGVVVEDSLIMSEDGRNRLLKVKLSAGHVSVFRDFSNLPGGLGAIAHYESVYYLCRGLEVYSFAKDSDPLLVAKLDQGNSITGIAIYENSAYVPVYSTGKVHKIDLSSGEATVFAEGLSYPEGILRIGAQHKP